MTRRQRARRQATWQGAGAMLVLFVILTIVGPSLA